MDTDGQLKQNPTVFVNPKILIKYHCVKIIILLNFFFSYDLLSDFYVSYKLQN